MRDKRGYDSMDEYIREEVLLLQGIDYTVLEKVTGECASRVYNALMHQQLEPGTKEAFNSQISEQREPTCLHDWSSRDEIQLLLKHSAKLVILRHL